MNSEIQCRILPFIVIGEDCEIYIEKEKAFRCGVYTGYNEKQMELQFKFNDVKFNVPIGNFIDTSNKHIRIKNVNTYTDS